MELLDESGRFQTAARKIPWCEFCHRAQGYFDVALNGQNASMYSKAILWQLHAVLPETDGALKRLSSLVQKVDELSAPWLPLT